MTEQHLYRYRPRMVCIGGLVTLLHLSIPISILGQAPTQNATRKFKVGDEIEYRFALSWRPGHVIAINQDHIDIEYKWGGSLHRKDVRPENLRFAWEAKALTPMRFWNSESKKFRVRAAAIKIDEDANSIRLHKVDGTEVDVPIDKLSRRDQIFLHQLTRGRREQPRAAGLPEITEFKIKDSWLESAWGSATDLATVPPDPPPSYATVPMAGVGFARSYFHESLVYVQPIGGSEGWMIAASINASKRKLARILWVSLASGQVKKVHWIPPGEYVVAVHPQSRQVLTFNGSNKQQPTLTVWDVNPRAETAIPTIRWISAGRDGSATWWGSWADFVSPNRVIHEVKSKHFVVWDIVDQREVFRIDQESFFGARPTLSPGKRLLALPEDKRVRIIEAATGETLAVLPIEGGRSAGVGFSADGTRLAVLTRSQLAVWELGTSNNPRRLRADTIGTPFAAHVEWVDDSTLLIDRKILYDMNRELPIWQYKNATFEVASESFGKRLISVLDGNLCYAVTTSRVRQSGFIVGAVDLPGPKVEQTASEMSEDSLWVIHRGTPVKLEVDCGEHNEMVEAALTKEILNNGWLLDPAADTVVKAKMGRGDRQTVKYKPMDGFGRQGTNRRTQTATITPYYSTLLVQFEGATAWRQGTGSGLPPVMYLKKGESAQQKANQLQRSYPEFFETIDIPERLFNPKLKKGFGSSTIGRFGLVPN